MWRICPACERRLELTPKNYWRRRKSKTGFFEYCKQCCKTKPFIVEMRKRARRKVNVKRKMERRLKRESDVVFSHDFYGHSNRIQVHIHKYSGIAIVVCLLLCSTSQAVFGHRQTVTKNMQMARTACFCRDWLKGNYADRNNDGVVDFKDYAIMTNRKAGL
jgi:hypothetical protein